MIACPTCFMSLEAVIKISEYMSSLFLRGQNFLIFHIVNTIVCPGVSGILEFQNLRTEKEAKFH